MLRVLDCLSGRNRLDAGSRGRLGPARRLLRRGRPARRTTERNPSSIGRRRGLAHARDHVASFRGHGRGRPHSSIGNGAHRNLAVARHPIDGVTVQAHCSTGISIYPQDGRDSETLIAHADTALYRAKTEGRGTIQFFEPTMDQQIRRGASFIAISAPRSRRVSLSSISNPRRGATASSPDSKLCCAGTIRSAERLHRASSFRSQKRPT
jgi:hypothetical protein